MKKLLMGIGIFFLLLILLFIASFIFYYVNREIPESFIADDFNIYVKVDSIKKLYTNLLDLKIADYLIRETEYNDIYKYILDFRNMDISRNVIVQKLLDFPLHIVLENNNSPLIIADIKYPSLFLGFLNLSSLINKPFISSVAKNKYLINIQNKEYYLIKHKNLFIFSSNKLVFNCEKSNNPIDKNEEFGNIKNKGYKNAFFRLFFAGSFITSKSGNLHKNIDSVLSRIELGKFTSMSVFASNDDIRISLDSSLETNDQYIKKVISRDKKPLNIIKYLSDTTNLFIKYDLGDLKDTYNMVISTLTNENKKKIVSLIKGIELLIGRSQDDLLFSWPGTDLGVIQLENAMESIYYVEISNKKNLNSVIDSLNKNNIIDKSADLIFDGIRLGKFKFSPVIYSLFNLFIKNPDMPYFIEIDSYMFFSNDPQALSYLARSYNENKTLVFDNNFKKAMRKNELNSDILMYYSTENGRFNFFKDNMFIDKLINLYKSGIISVNSDKGQINVSFSAAGTDSLNIRNFPGFPQKSSDVIIGNAYFAYISGKKVPDILYTTKNGSIHAKSVTERYCKGYPLNVSPDSTINYIDHDSKDITLFSKRGSVHKINFDGSSVQPFPLVTSYRGSWEPITWNKSYLYYSVQKRSIEQILFNGTQKTMSYKFDAPVLHKPSFEGKNIVVATTSVDGQILLFNDLFNIAKDPITIGSQIKSSSILHNNSIYGLSYSGSLFGYDLNGNIKKGFPIELKGSYSITPLILPKRNSNILVTLSNDGLVNYITENGKITNQLKLPEADYSRAALLSYDINKNGNKEAILYNSGNTIHCLTVDCNFFQGFPVVGYSKPDFIDIDNDGNIEMITTTIDNNINVYTIMKE